MPNRMAEITEKIRKLEANCLVFPPEIERARKLIRQELKNQGIDTEVFIFAELVQEVVDPEWRRAVETFLGRMKNEMHCVQEKDHGSFESFSKAVDEYMYYYNNKRIQSKTKWMPPIVYRETSMCLD